MITNDRQHALTTTAVTRFEQALTSLESHLDDGDDNARALKLIHRNAIESEIDVLREQLSGYEALRSGAPSAFPVASLEDLPTTVIKARIVTGLTEQQLAERLGVETSVIEKAEASQYGETSLGFLMEAASALGIVLHGEAVLSGNDTRAAD
jgi:HTH-type transcriptional regulator/antitoxin HigA